MKNVKRILSFAVVFIVVMVAFCTASFADESQYTDNVIPKISNYKSSSGIVTPVYSNSGYSTWYAFDRDIHTYTTTPYIAFEFPNLKAITKYTII